MQNDKMNAQKESGAQATNEQTMVFQFSENRQEMQTTFHNGEPWLVAVDVCQILGLSQPTRALEGLDEDEKLPLLIVRAGQKREVNCINESGLYNLIFKSRKPEAKTFRKWVTSEVLPAIRKKGIYAMNNNRYNDDFIDARNIPYQRIKINNATVRMITVDKIDYYSINDYHTAINSRTSANQSAKKLNTLESLAVKIWLFGNTHPAWFTKWKGLELLASGSRIMKSNQLALPL
jgi:prophage antirepressor-like protein